MKKNFILYAFIWAIVLAAFNAVVFLVRPVFPWQEINYDARFWVAWAFIIAAFLGNLLCAFIGFRAESLNKLFFNMPLIVVNWSSLIGMMVIGCSLMLIPDCPAWVTAIVCIIVFSFDAIAMIKAVWAANVAQGVEKKTENKIAFIKDLTADAEGIRAQAKSDAVRAECRKVSEAIRYSDPMSDENLSEIEEKITLKMDELFGAVDKDDAEATATIADELLVLIGERNRKCKLSK